LAIIISGPLGGILIMSFGYKWLKKIKLESNNNCNKSEKEIEEEDEKNNKGAHINLKRASTILLKTTISNAGEQQQLE
jgi:uncharacterized membrane protein